VDVLTADGVLLLAAGELPACVTALVAEASEFALLAGVPPETTTELPARLCDAARRGCAVRIVLTEEDARASEPVIRELLAAGVVVLAAARPIRAVAASEAAAIEFPSAFADVPDRGAPAVYLRRRAADARWVHVVARAKLAACDTVPALEPRRHWPLTVPFVRDVIHDFARTVLPRGR
jgi:hypothetical protein